jgi:hypothetical protein
MDVYDTRPLPVSGTGGISLGPASAAQAAVQRAAALEGPRMLRCELCQVRCSSADSPMFLLPESEEGMITEIVLLSPMQSPGPVHASR